MSLVTLLVWRAQQPCSHFLLPRCCQGLKYRHSSFVLQWWLDKQLCYGWFLFAVALWPGTTLVKRLSPKIQRLVCRKLLTLSLAASIAHSSSGGFRQASLGSVLYQ